jgi:DnaD/phage-associated family protein
MRSSAQSPSAETRIPDEYLRDVLERVQDVAELKAILQVLRRAGELKGGAVPLADVLRPDIMRSIVGLDSPVPAEERLRRALERAVANRFVLRVTVENETYFVPATAEGRQAVEGLRAGVPEAADRLQLPSDSAVILYRSNIFALYEQHIGPLTPLVAERLRDAERSYPRAWIERAVLSAVHYNRRSWPYVEAILARWERGGGPDETNG